MFKLLAFLSISFTFSATAISINTTQSNEFKKIIHFRSSLIGQRSEIDSPEFFLAKDGKTNYMNELFANIEAVQNPNYLHPLSKKNYQCTFPRRYTFIKENFLKGLPELKCDDFFDWIKQFNFKKVSLVFSSYYPNNPSSLFGHTFLRLKSANDGQDNLRDYIINFSAHTSESNGLAFAWNGLTGGYRGLFDIKPYYVKINEYTLNESRDLWEYELDLNTNEIEKLLMSYWEIANSQSYFDYYFLNENCSYFILALLEAGKPSLDLTKYFFVYTIPSETAQIIYTPAIPTSFRPSLKTQLEYYYQKLSEEEKIDFNTLLKNKKIVQKISSNVLNVAILYERFYVYENKTTQSNFLKTLLVERAKSPGIVQPLQNIAIHDLQGISSAPHVIHPPTRLHLGFGYIFDDPKDLSFISYELKPGVHSFIDPPNGFPERSTLEVLSFKLNYFTSSNTLQLDNVQYLKLFSSELVSAIYKPFSWKVGLFSERIYMVGISEVSHNAKVGFGKSYRFFGLDHSLLLGTQFQYFSYFDKSWNMAMFLEYLNFVYFSLKGRASFSIQYDYSLLAESSPVWQQRLSTKFELQYDFNHQSSAHLFSKLRMANDISAFDRQIGLNYVHRF